MKTLSILGSTGSIGKNVLEVIRLNKDYFKIFALSCYKNVELLKLQCLEFKPEFAVVSSFDDANSLKESFKNKIKTKILFEKGSYSYIASHEKVTHVVAAITGFAGLQSTFDAAKAGKEILLANKESMVMAGPLILSEVARNKSKIIPVTSESLNQPAKRPLKTGFVIEKAKKELDFNPRNFDSGIQFLEKKISQQINIK